jgi:hypothetical protein
MRQGDGANEQVSEKADPGGNWTMWIQLYIAHPFAARC